jgi:pilus assembly protein Flp/PilA
MDRLARAVRRFVSDEEGAALVEYALLVALIAVVAIIALTALGGNIKSQFEKIATAIGNAGEGS